MTDTTHTKHPAIFGRVYPALQSTRLTATLFSREPVESAAFETNDLVLDVVNEDGSVIASALLSEVDVDAPIGSAPRRMTFPDGSVFETEDHEAVEGLTGETHGSVLHYLEQFRPRLLAFVLACIAAAWMLWRYGLDILVAGAIALTPPVLVEQIDKGSMSTIDFAMAEESLLDEAEKARVRKIFDRLVTYVDEDEAGTSKFQLLFRSMPDVGPNAFALPNGTIVMTDEFVEEFNEDDILATVLGHEIGHVVDKHGLRQTYRSLGIYVLVAFLAGETGPFIEEMLLEGNLLLSLSYSREHETAADHYGLHLAHDAGYDPNGMKKFFEWVAENAIEPPQWLSTHPNSEERVQEIDDFIQTLN